MGIDRQSANNPNIARGVVCVVIYWPLIMSPALSRLHLTDAVIEGIRLVIRDLIVELRLSYAWEPVVVNVVHDVSVMQVEIDRPTCRR